MDRLCRAGAAASPLVSSRQPVALSLAAQGGILAITLPLPAPAGDMSGYSRMRTYLTTAMRSELHEAKRFLSWVSHSCGGERSQRCGRGRANAAYQRPSSAAAADCGAARETARGGIDQQRRPHQAPAGLDLGADHAGRDRDVFLSAIRWS